MLFNAASFEVSLEERSTGRAWGGGNMYPGP
jgi:hypothetical protein